MWTQFSQESALFVSSTFSLFFVRCGEVEVGPQSTLHPLKGGKNLCSLIPLHPRPAPPSPRPLDTVLTLQCPSLNWATWQRSLLSTTDCWWQKTLRTIRTLLSPLTGSNRSAVQSAVFALTGSYIHHKTSKTKEHFQSTHTLWVLIVLKHIIA